MEIYNVFKLILVPETLNMKNPRDAARHLWAIFEFEVVLMLKVSETG